MTTFLFSHLVIAPICMYVRYVRRMLEQLRGGPSRGRGAQSATCRLCWRRGAAPSVGCRLCNAPALEGRGGTASGGVLPIARWLSPSGGSQPRGPSVERSEQRVPNQSGFACGWGPRRAKGRQSRCHPHAPRLPSVRAQRGAALTTENTARRPAMGASSTGAAMGWRGGRRGTVHT